ncbi:MAG: site-2 protease family protein [Phycisphaeraceae bacterium]|nr:site-2 protease family protein [Phycisphaeraceae bacterium]QYK49505.1 MAG: site-2 protease family protein [Phycisphaeraceae bacterium]
MDWWWAGRMLESNPVALVSWVVVVIGSIVLHELAHGWVATRLGDDTPRLSGHLTINPLVHIPPMAWLLFALFGFTWGQMPVNSARLRGRYGDAIVSLAGPLMNLLIALGAIVALCLWIGFGQGHWVQGFRFEEPLFTNTARFWMYAVVLNVILCLFNLLPVPPLDGFRIAASVFPPVRRMLDTERGAQFGLLAFVLLFFFGAKYVVGFGASIGGAAIGIAMGIVLPNADLPTFRV